MKTVLFAALFALPLAAQAETGTIATVLCESGTGASISTAVSRATTTLNSDLASSLLKDGTSGSAPTISTQTVSPDYILATICVTITRSTR